MSTSIAQGIENPRFFNGTDKSVWQRVLNISFGWFKTLDQEQKTAYYGSIVLALEEAEVDHFVRWYKNGASGMIRVAWIRPSNTGFCKRLHFNVIAYNTEQNFQNTVCFNDVDNRWYWYQ